MLTTFFITVVGALLRSETSETSGQRIEGSPLRLSSVLRLSYAPQDKLAIVLRSRLRQATRGGAGADGARAGQQQSVDVRLRPGANVCIYSVGFM